MEKSKRFWVIAIVCIATVLLYFILPIDAIPDIIAGIGWLDDLVFGLLGLAGLLVNVLWALGVLPAPGSSGTNYYDTENYAGYGEYREV